MRALPFASRLGIAVALFAAAVFALAGCGDKEPEERMAFSSLLRDTILGKGGIVMEPLSREAEKSIGGYREHYAVLETFQKNMAGETAKNARAFLSLAEMSNLAAVAGAEESLKKAMNDADALRKTVETLWEKADRAKSGLKIPDDLAPTYAAAYEKIVTNPSRTAQTALEAVHGVFAAILDLLDFIKKHNRDLEITDTSINVKNPALMDDVNAKMAAVRKKSAELCSAYAAMIQTLR